MTLYYMTPYILFLQLQFTVEISYFEIYNEKIHDLLAPSKKKDNKRVQVIVQICYYINIDIN